MSESQHIARLLFRYIRKELSAKEIAELKAWRDADPKNEEFFQEETDPDFIRAAYARRFLSKETVYKKIQEKYPGPWKNETTHQMAPVYRISRFVASLVTIALLAGSYFFLSHGHHHKTGDAIYTEKNYASIELFDGTIIALDDFNRGRLAGAANIDFEETPSGETVYAAYNSTVARKKEMNKLYTAAGGHLILRLPDSSHVWLNEQSSISYPPNFSSDSIKIIIEGEAYFQQANHSKKFYSIAVRPTSAKNSFLINSSFAYLNLRSYPDEDSSTFTLLKGNGSIYVSDKTGSILSSANPIPGQQIIWDGVKFSSPSRADIKKVMAWEKW